MSYLVGIKYKARIRTQLNMTFSIPEVPSDLFAVVTRCLEPVSSLAVCPEAMLDADAFIFPQNQMMSNCLVSYPKTESAHF